MTSQPASQSAERGFPGEQGPVLVPNSEAQGPRMTAPPAPRQGRRAGAGLLLAGALPGTLPAAPGASHPTFFGDGAGDLLVAIDPCRGGGPVLGRHGSREGCGRGGDPASHCCSLPVCLALSTPLPPPFPPHKAHPRSGPPLGPHRSTSAGMLGKSSPSRGSPKSRAESLRLLPGPPKLPPPERAAPRPGPSLRLPGAHPPYFPFTRRRRTEMPMSAPSRRAPRTTQGTRSASSRGVQSSAGAVPAGSGSESPSGRQRRDGGFSWPPVLPAALSPLPF